jgi:hypothetical protein
MIVNFTAQSLLCSSSRATKGRVAIQKKMRNKKTLDCRGAYTPRNDDALWRNTSFYAHFK